LKQFQKKINYENRLEEVSLFKRNFWKISKRYYKGNIAGKSITRINNKINNLGIHVPEPKKEYTLKSKFSLRGRILHFDCAGFLEWKDKWLNRHKKITIAEEMGEGRKKMIKEFGEVYKKRDKDGLTKLYKKQFMFSYNLKRFFLLFGILKRIKIKKELFEKPKNA
jgi:hypothetical protein